MGETSFNTELLKAVAADLLKVQRKIVIDFYLYFEGGLKGIT